MADRGRCANSKPRIRVAPTYTSAHVERMRTRTRTCVKSVSNSTHAHLQICASSRRWARYAGVAPHADEWTGGRRTWARADVGGVERGRWRVGTCYLESGREGRKRAGCSASWAWLGVGGQLERDVVRAEGEGARTLRSLNSIGRPPSEGRSASRAPQRRGKGCRVHVWMRDLRGPTWQLATCDSQHATCDGDGGRRRAGSVSGAGCWVLSRAQETRAEVHCLRELEGGMNGSRVG